MMRGLRVGWLETFVVLLAGACVPTAQHPKSRAGSALLPSIQATTRGDSVSFALQVTNTGETPVVLACDDSQSCDFVVSREGQEVWRWSNEPRSSGAPPAGVIAPGETRRLDAVWVPPPDASGNYMVTGVLTTRDERVEQATPFQIS